VKYFCNARNAIPYIQDIKIINAFHNGVSDVKTVKEIAMKKPKTVVDLLIVTDVCIEASEAWARLLKSRGKGTSSKKDDREVNTADRGDRKDLPFVAKISIGRHKVPKTLIDSGASLNLMMRKTFIEMGLNLAELTPVHDTFHGIIPGQSSTPIRRIDLEVSYGSRENKRREMLTFEVASFDIGYNCILGRPILLKFMAIIHTAYATIKMSEPKGVIILKSDQRDALACENAMSHTSNGSMRRKRRSWLLRWPKHTEEAFRSEQWCPSHQLVVHSGHQ
jgi:hypothetical protein